MPDSSFLLRFKIIFCYSVNPNGPNSGLSEALSVAMLLLKGMANVAGLVFGNEGKSFGIGAGPVWSSMEFSLFLFAWINPVRFLTVETCDKKAKGLSSRASLGA